VGQQALLWAAMHTAQHLECNGDVAVPMRISFLHTSDIDTQPAKGAHKHECIFTSVQSAC
jgi:hypothetical protein